MKYPKVSWLLLLCLFSIGWLQAQFDIPPKPPLGKQTSVYDYYGLLEPAQSRQLEQKLIRYSDSTSTQIVIAIIASTEGENINYLGAQWGEQWGIGQAKEDNGILLLLARDDRRVAINTGEGIEEYLTDALSKRIIERIIIPEFKKGDYYAGLNKGSDAIFEVLTGSFQAPQRSRQSSGKFPFRALFPFVIFVVIIIILASRKNRGGGGRGGRRKRGLDLWDVIILSNMGRSGSKGGFGSGGSFGGGGGFGGGFGGGGFGGGGASGGW